MKTLLLCLSCCLLTACSVAPEGVQPVTGFQVERYLGRWHEIARLDHRFERGLEQVTADYSLNTDGTLRVVNRGLDVKEGRWREAVGRARFTGASTTGQLEVSFFGPFYGGYNIIALDPDYQHVLVSGPSRDYLWILARTPTLAPEVYARLSAQAEALGFPVTELLRVPQGG